MKRRPDILYLLLLCLSTGGALRVTVWPSEVSVLRGRDAIITCSVSELNLNNPLELVWSRKATRGNSTDVYYYHNGEVKLSTPRYHVTTEEIPNGNATLHISALQFGDEGEYTCAVGNTPEQTEGTSTLQVSAQPSVTLTPEILVVELGTERSAMCEATNVYPSTVTIRWVRHNKGSPGCVALDKGTCTTDPVTNSDGTFNVTSHLTLNPQKEDDGYRYSCIIEHRSLDTKIERSLTLILTEKPDHTGAIVGAVIGTLLCCLLPMTIAFYYLKMVKKDPPTVSDITGNDQLTDMSRTTLTCHIIDYRPEDITIKVYLRRSREEKETIYTWKSREHPAQTQVTTSRGDTDGTVSLDMEQQRGLMNGGHENRPLQLEMVPVTSKKRFGLYSCQCSLHITPSYDTDNGAELSLHVTHPAMTSPLGVWRTLSVVGVPPNIMEIVTPGRIQHEEQVTLTCPIFGFKPKALSITWLRRERDGGESELLTWNGGGNHSQNGRYSHNVKEKNNDDKSYNFMSALTLKASIIEDDGVTYICRTFHPATRQQATEKLDMVVTAAPLLDSILTVPEVVSVGNDLSLSCRIHSFYPGDIQVTWYTEYGMRIGSRPAEVLSEANNLHYFTSTAIYTPTMKDMGKKFRCEVQHQSLTAPKSITWTLSELVSPPNVSDIRSDPAPPQSGQPVTLSCEVTDVYPAPLQIQWYRGLTKLPSDQWKEAIKQDPESNMYSGTIELTLTPQSHEHGEKITAEITHSARNVTKEFILHLKGLPIVGEISSDQKLDYGRPLTLRCAVTGCDPRDITLIWIQGSREPREGKVRRDGDGLLYTLTTTPTAEDYGKVYSCQVTHRSLRQPITRTHHLRLSEKAPQLSDITVRPVRARANQEASFRVVISGFCPREIQVRWYKGFSTFPSSAVTSSEPQIGQDSLYTCSTTLTFTPTLSDDNSGIRCEVTHTASKSMQEKRLTLNLSGNDQPDHRSPGGGKTSPVKEEKPVLRIERIECRTECPRVGEEVTLVARVTGCEAESSEFSWYKGMYPIVGEMENQQHGTSCTSSITFTAEDSDTDCTIRLEVTYNYQTAEESCHLTPDGCLTTSSLPPRTSIPKEMGPEDARTKKWEGTTPESQAERTRRSKAQLQAEDQQQGDIWEQGKGLQKWGSPIVHQATGRKLEPVIHKERIQQLEQSQHTETQG